MLSILEQYRLIGRVRRAPAAWVLAQAIRLLCPRSGEPNVSSATQLRRGLLWHFVGSAFGSSPPALPGVFQQLDISHGSPRDERALGVFSFGFFLNGFYEDSTGVAANQPSVEAAPSGEPHGYPLSVPLLRQIPGQRASPVRLRSSGILPLSGPVGEFNN
jgi:hypothetical protein